MEQPEPILGFLAGLDFPLILNILKWCVFIMILIMGGLDVYRHYLIHLEHWLEWSAAYYVVFIYFIPYLVIDLIVLFALSFAKIG